MHTTQVSENVQISLCWTWWWWWTCWFRGIGTKCYKHYVVSIDGGSRDKSISIWWCRTVIGLWRDFVTIITLLINAVFLVNIGFLTMAVQGFLSFGLRSMYIWGEGSREVINLCRCSQTIWRCTSTMLLGSSYWLLFELWMWLGVWDLNCTDWKVGVFCTYGTATAGGSWFTLAWVAPRWAV